MKALRVHFGPASMIRLEISMLTKKGFWRKMFRDLYKDLLGIPQTHQTAIAPHNGQLQLFRM